MSYGYVLDTPPPTLTVGVGDTDPVDFTLKSDGAVINLTGYAVEMRLRPIRGEALTVQSYKTTDTTPQISVVSPPTSGVVRFVPQSTTWQAGADQYRAYFIVGTGQRVPQDEEIWVEVIPSF